MANIQTPLLIIHADQDRRAGVIQSEMLYKSLKILNGEVDLEFQVRAAVDAGALATALESHGFEVEPPVTTRKDATTFDSVLEARWSGRPSNSSRPGSPPTEANAKRDVPVRLTSAGRESKQ